MKYNILLLLIIIGAIIVYTVFNDRKAAIHNAIVSLQEDFSFTALDGTQQNYFTYKTTNTIVLIHFWATWCAPCIKELPQLMAMTQNNPSVTVLALAVQNKPQDIKKFLSSLSSPVPDRFVIGLDPDKILSQKTFNTEKLPETFILSPTGQKVKKLAGAVENWTAPEWENYFQKIILENK